MGLKELGPLIGSSLKTGANALVDIYKEHAPRIWTGVCITGVIFLPFMSASAMLKSMQLIEAKEKELGRKLSKWEIFRICWKCWIGTTATVGVTAGSAIMSLEESEKKLALMATSIQILSETQKTDILDKVEEVAGKKKRDEVANRIAADDVRNLNPDDIQHTKFGIEPWLEPYSGTAWWGDHNSTKQAELEIQKRFALGERPRLGDFFDELGVHCNSRLKNIYLNPDFKLKYPSMTRLSNDKMCNVISYDGCPFDMDSVADVFKMRFWDDNY